MASDAGSPAVIAWVVKLALGRAGGSGVALVAGLAALIGVSAGFAAAWNWQGARWAADVEAMQRVEAQALAEANLRTLEAEREAHAQARAVEDVYVQMAELRATRAGEVARLSADLDRAIERMRRAGAGRDGGTGLSGDTAAAGSCADIRAARDRLADALGRIVAGGGAIIADGQRGIDVATICARASAAPAPAGKVSAP